MKKHLFLTSLVALIATAGMANAETDVTFGGNYTTTSGTTANVGTGEPGAYDFSYTGTNTDGTATAEIDSNTADGVDKANFAYKLADGSSADLSDDNEYAATDYTNTTVAGTTGYENVHVADDYGLNAQDSVVAGAYSYLNPQYDSADESSQQYIVFDNNATERTLTETYTTNGTYTSGSATITSDTVADDLMDLYSYQGANESTNLYQLYKKPDDSIGVKNMTLDGHPNVDLDTLTDLTLKAALQGMIDAYAEDSGTNLTTATTALGVLQTQEHDNFTAAQNAYNADNSAQQVLRDNYNTYTAAHDAYIAATDENSDYQQALNNRETDMDSFEAANALYGASIKTTLNDTIDTSVNSGTIKTALDTKQNVLTDAQQAAVDSGITADKVSAYDTAVGNMGTIHGLIESADATQTSTGVAYNGNLAVGTTVEDHLEALDTAIGDRRNLSGDYVSNADVATNLQSLNDGIEDEVQRATNAEGVLQTAINDETTRATNAENALQAAIDNINTASVAAVSALDDRVSANTQAISGLNNKVDSLEKNVSGGVAAATALSAVEVSNVKKGEMSVGGGYGYYNSQSAMALGAALGLTDNWSVNAGAGIASGDKTQVSFRAGTNYKFKLF